jgi:hypothetical protein
LLPAVIASSSSYENTLSSSNSQRIIPILSVYQSPYRLSSLRYISNNQSLQQGSSNITSVQNKKGILVKTHSLLDDIIEQENTEDDSSKKTSVMIENEKGKSDYVSRNYYSPNETFLPFSNINLLSNSPSVFLNYSLSVILQNLSKFLLSHSSSSSIHYNVTPFCEGNSSFMTFSDINNLLIYYSSTLNTTRYLLHSSNLNVDFDKVLCENLCEKIDNADGIDGSNINNNLNTYSTYFGIHSFSSNNILGILPFLQNIISKSLISYTVPTSFSSHISLSSLLSSFPVYPDDESLEPHISLNSLFSVISYICFISPNALQMYFNNEQDLLILPRLYYSFRKDDMSSKIKVAHTVSLSSFDISHISPSQIPPWYHPIAPLYVSLVKQFHSSLLFSFSLKKTSPYIFYCGDFSSIEKINYIRILNGLNASDEYSYFENLASSLLPPIIHLNTYNPFGINSNVLCVCRFSIICDFYYYY